MSLTEFADSKRPPSCKFCTLPERDECDEAYKQGTATRKNILQWLHEHKGYTSAQITSSALDKHYTNGHQHEVRA
jgi:hypothetical protein